MKIGSAFFILGAITFAIISTCFGLELYGFFLSAHPELRTPIFLFAIGIMVFGIGLSQMETK